MANFIFLSKFLLFMIVWNVHCMQYTSSWSRRHHPLLDLRYFAPHAPNSHRCVPRPEPNYVGLHRRTYSSPVPPSTTKDPFPLPKPYIPNHVFLKRSFGRSRLHNRALPNARPRGVLNGNQLHAQASHFERANPGLGLAATWTAAHTAIFPYQWSIGHARPLCSLE